VHRINRYIGNTIRYTLEYLFRLLLIINYKCYGIKKVCNVLSKCNDTKVIYILKKFGAIISGQVNFAGSIIIENAHDVGDFSHLFIGKNCFIGRNVFFDLTGKIFIGSDCAISANVTLLTHADPGERPMRQHYERKVAPIHIGSGSWIGAGSIILPGIMIGKLCVIGAGTVVTKDIPDNTRILTKKIYEEKKLIQNNEFLTATK
jgi:acetyltransferase-like isoleucine patch superfamily enzyme